LALAEKCWHSKILPRLLSPADSLELEAIPDQRAVSRIPATPVLALLFMALMKEAAVSAI